MFIDKVPSLSNKGLKLLYFSMNEFIIHGTLKVLEINIQLLVFYKNIDLYFVNINHLYAVFFFTDLLQLVKSFLHFYFKSAPVHYNVMKYFKCQCTIKTKARLRYTVGGLDLIKSSVYLFFNK